MITIDKLKVYQKYGGDIDMWSRGASNRDRSIMDDRDWSNIDKAIQLLTIIQNGHASPELQLRTQEFLSEIVDTEDAIQFLRFVFFKS